MLTIYGRTKFNAMEVVEKGINDLEEAMEIAEKATFNVFIICDSDTVFSDDNEQPSLKGIRFYTTGGIEWIPAKFNQKLV